LFAQNNAAENTAPVTWQNPINPAIKLLIPLLKRCWGLATRRASSDSFKQTPRFMADCSITAGIHLIVAQGFVTKNNASPFAPLCSHLNSAIEPRRRKMRSL
jgi:hypothetical protein